MSGNVIGFGECLGNRMLVQDGGDLRKELIQVAALAVAWVESIPARPAGEETQG